LRGRNGFTHGERGSGGSGTLQKMAATDGHNLM